MNNIIRIIFLVAFRAFGVFMGIFIVLYGMSFTLLFTITKKLADLWAIIPGVLVMIMGVVLVYKVLEPFETNKENK